MTRFAAHAFALVVAALGGALGHRLAGVSWPVTLGVAAAAWLLAAAAVAIARHLVSRRTVARQGVSGPLARGMAAAAAVDRVAGGGDGFTAADGALRALERAVLLLPAREPLRGAARERLEQAVRSDLARSTPQARAALVGGLRDAGDVADEALRSPLHPLAPLAPELLARLRLAPAVPWHGRRRRQEWQRRRAVLDPCYPAEGLAARLLAAGLERAALAALSHAAPSARARRLRRLARCRTLLLDAARGTFLAVAPSTLIEWREELLLLAGRRLPELVPGSPLLRAVPGGAMALERMVAQTPAVVAELTTLLEESPELERPVATVVARIVGWPVGAVVSALREGTLAARPDEALRLHLRGLALLDERRLSEAGAEFEAALVQAPDFAQTAFALASTKRRMGHVAAGEAVLRALVDRRPREPEPGLYLARYLSSVGERERAHEVYQRAVGRFPECVPLRVAFAQELLSWGRAAEAAEQLRAAREQAPDEPRLALLAGRTLAAEIRSDEAAQALELAARGLRGAERAEAWFWLMNVRRDQGDHATAQRIARRLVHALGRGQSSLLEEVAEYLEERQDYVRAREASERVRRLREGGG